MLKGRKEGKKEGKGMQRRKDDAKGNEGVGRKLKERRKEGRKVEKGR